MSVLIVLILVMLAVSQTLHLLPRLVAVDFYQYWTVGAAPRLTHERLGSPYTDPRKYAAVAKDYAERIEPWRFTVQGRVLGPPSFTGTPFIYMLFAALPADYTRALTVYHVLQILLFVGAVVLLGVVYHYEVFPLLCLTFVLVLGSGALSSDLRVGNVGSFQFAGLALLLYLADRARRAAPPGALALDAAVLTGLTLLALAKPNVALIAITMGMHLLLARGLRRIFVAAVPAVLAGAAAVGLACLYFGSWTIWHEWYRSIFGKNPYSLAVRGGTGNYSTSLLLARWLDTDVFLVTAVMAALLGVSVIAVLARSGRLETGGWARLRGASARVFGDPRLAMSIGVVLTLTLPALVWFHYYVIALIPGLWLLGATSGWRFLPLCGLVGLALSSGLLVVLFVPLGWPDAVGVAASASFIPLWAGILAVIQSPAALEPGAVGGVTVAPEGQREREPRLGRRAHGKRATGG